MSGEKTEEPTEKKLKDARKKGEGPKSQDVNAAAGLVAMLVCLVAAGDSLVEQLGRALLLAMEPGVAVRSNAELLAVMVDQLRAAFMAVLPLLAVSVGAGLLAAFAQVGMNVSFEPVSPNFDKLNPAEGLKKLFSVRSLIDFIKMVIKAAVLGVVVWLMVRDLVPLLVGSAYYAPAAIGVLAWKVLLKLMAAGTLVFIIIGPVDWGIQQWLFRRDQKMTKDDVKREHKEAEGDPQLKGHRRELAREMATSPPEKRVPGATVVVTNPTHYAVALRYDRNETQLPIVVAKGMDAEALRIRAIAEQHHVPIVGNPPLARALHTLRLDEPIPEHLFEAVAAVLRWVAYLRSVAPGQPQPGQLPAAPR
jgi:type III secretion protein U